MGLTVRHVPQLPLQTAIRIKPEFKMPKQEVFAPIKNDKTFENDFSPLYIFSDNFQF